MKETPRAVLSIGFDIMKIHHVRVREGKVI
jgi:hypothetical protein